MKSAVRKGASAARPRVLFNLQLVNLQILYLRAILLNPFAVVSNDEVIYVPPQRVE